MRHRPLPSTGFESDVILIDDISGAVPLDYPVGFANLDGGKTRHANDPAVAALADRFMVGGEIALDDAWQGAEMPHARAHHGQIMLVHELRSSGAWAPLFVPSPPSRWAAPPAQIRRELIRTREGAESPFESHKTVAMRK